MIRMVVAALLLVVTGCPRHGIVTDGSSVSWGWANDGALLDGIRLPNSGPGYHTPQRWRSRGLRYGTSQLVATIEHVGRELNKAVPGASVGVADLSLKQGGRSAWHRSHQTGRDVDLVFVSRKANGKLTKARAMYKFDGKGASVAGLTFDVEANWTIVKALMLNPHGRIQYAFVSDDLRQLLLDHAERTDEPIDIIMAASYILRQPSDSLPHDDHFHIRLLCDPEDNTLGCLDYGTLQWYKHDLKYHKSGSKRLEAAEG